MNLFKTICILSFFIFPLNAQAKQIKGEILYANNTIEVTFKIPIGLLSSEPDYEKLQYKIKYFDNNGEKFIIKPDEAKEIRFNYLEENIRLVSKLNTIGNGRLFSSNTNIFLKLQIEGELKLYKYYFIKTTYNANMHTTSSTLVSEYFLEKKNNELFSLGQNGLIFQRPIMFIKDMEKYISDCPELIEKIERKEFRRRDIETIVKYYNSKCK